MKRENKYELLLQKMPMLMVNAYERNVLNGQLLKQLVDRYGKAQNILDEDYLIPLPTLAGLLVGMLVLGFSGYFHNEWLKSNQSTEVILLLPAFGLLVSYWLIARSSRADKEINSCEPPLIEFEESIKHLNPYGSTDVSFNAVAIKWRTVEAAKVQLEAEESFKSSRQRETDNVDAVIASSQQLKKAQGILYDMWKSIWKFEAIVCTRREIFDLARERMKTTRH